MRDRLAIATCSCCYLLLLPSLLLLSLPSPAGSQSSPSPSPLPSGLLNCSSNPPRPDLWTCENGTWVTNQSIVVRANWSLSGAYFLPLNMNITGPVSVTLNDTSISVGGSLSLTNMSAINVNKGTLSVQGDLLFADTTSMSFDSRENSSLKVVGCVEAKGTLTVTANSRNSDVGGKVFMIADAKCVIGEFGSIVMKDADKDPCKFFGQPTQSVASGRLAVTVGILSDCSAASVISSIPIQTLLFVSLFLALC